MTRSTVQKAVVVITESPQTFSAVREKLSVVTRAWFAQKYVCFFQETGCLALDWEAVWLIREQGLYGLGYPAGVSRELGERLRAS